MMMFASFRHTNPIVENGQTHPCQKVIQEVKHLNSPEVYLEESFEYFHMKSFLLISDFSHVTHWSFTCDQ